MGSWLYCNIKKESLNPILLNLFRAIDSSKVELQKPTKVTIYKAKTT